jgi:hypothetical protein
MAVLSNTTYRIKPLLPFLDPAVRRIGLRRDDDIAENRVVPDGHWPVYSVFRRDAGKDICIGLNIMYINQQINV